MTRHAHYTSTACIHGRHDECRGVCKFCSAPCRCRHHKASHAVTVRVVEPE